ncbi:sex hormone-binding globulin [Bufo gargarizans]|uniref:sex hormone-binding globulin n=1 Tax=Bufo gargarizans TaxID=30331 RepID=UPI001CF115B0|nr:sex hormone-binding globulin [Bufo gargarizans]
MKPLISVSLPVVILLSYGVLTAGSILPDPEDTAKVSCSAEKLVRSSDSLYIGNGDARSVLRLEFKLSELTSNLSSFDFRTFDPEGIIFYGDVGRDNWFVLGVRERRLEVQMSNGNGQMVLSKWGPDVSDGKWRKVTVDSTINTIDVRVNGEIVVMLTYHVNNELVPQSYSTLSIILGDLPSDHNLQLLKPLVPALDGCLRNWAWVKKNTEALDRAMEMDENRRCFQNEEPGAFFPARGFATFKPAAFPTKDKDSWSLILQLAFRVLEDGGVLLGLSGARNVFALTITFDLEKQVLEVSLLGKLAHSLKFPPGVCLKDWHTVNIVIQSNQVVLTTTEASSSMDIVPADFKALEDIWLDPASEISIGGTSEQAEPGARFSGCLKIILQGTAVEVDSAEYKHPHVHSHSCPLAV